MICEESAPFVWNGQTVITTIDSIYTHVDTDINGLDSTVYLEVTIYPTIPPIPLDSALCLGSAPFIWEGQTILTDVDSIYTFATTNSLGCDSVLTFNITILQPSYTTLDTILVEDSPTYVWNEQEILTDHDSIYIDTLMNAAGCDSIVTYEVIVLPENVTPIDTTICEDSAPFVWNGQTVITTIDSIYTHVDTDINGLDSTVYLEVTIYPTIPPIPLDSALCMGSAPFIWEGQTILTDVDSIYTFATTNSLGCDSVLTLNITILQPSYTTLDTILVEYSPTFVWNEQEILTDHDSIYIDTLMNAAGCDSIVTYEVIVLPENVTPLDTTICEDTAPFVWNGQTVITTKDSIYTHFEKDINGLDSTLILTVNIISIEPVKIDTVLCQGTGTIDFNGRAISTANEGFYTFIDTLVSSGGCDSIVTLEVTINPATYSDTTVIVNDTELPYTWNGVEYNVPGTYNTTLTNVNGCDSLLTLNLNVIYEPGTVYDTICPQDIPYSWNGKEFSTEGVHSVTLTSVITGADSIVKLSLTFEPEITPIFEPLAHIVNTKNLMRCHWFLKME